LGVACFGLIDVGLSLTCCTLFSFSVFTADLGSYRPSVSSLCWDVARDTILIGTRGSEIYEISASDGSDQHGGPLVQGHCEHELWGLAVHPSKSQVCTVGDDKTVRVWDTASKQLLKMTKLDTAARTCAYSPDGMTIAVGLGAPESSGVTRSKKDGALVVLNEEDLTVIFESKCGMVRCLVSKTISLSHLLTRYLCFLSLFHNKIYIARDTKKWIRSIRFSPDNNVLALASGDSSVYLYNVEDFTSIGRCRGCSGPVTRIDFSSDSQWLHCNSGKQQNAPNKVVLFVVVRVYVY
jgi:microtubule-associated protein-like 6